MNITQFTIEDVRCFSERQTLEIRPLTFLVGENSTGKTTALACFQVLADYLRGEGVDFNADPYSMGIFKDIVRNSRPKAKSFKLGFTVDFVKWIVEFTQKTGGIEPAISSLSLKLSDGEIVFRVVEDWADRPDRLIDFDKKHNRCQINCDTDDLNIFHSSFVSGYLDLELKNFLEYDAEEKTALANYVETLQNSEKWRYDPWYMGDELFVFSTSPIRSRPKRTYDPTREFNDPEGSDVPMYLMRIEAIEKKDWEAVKTQLVEFGRNSGLFENIDVKNFGGSLGAPFQLQVKVRGPKANIIDVGYGVSQILPVLVHILKSDPSEMTYFLLQQPEVHLHPKAQAELSSLLARLANEGNRAFIVETHSDYMIDRVRIDIIRGNIRPEDVSLIYFEPKGRIVNVYNIGFDKMGNMENVPPHYGEFFLKESKRLLGFKE
ncbi:MAG: AAA family ATPase [Candidatus Poribacteria bacterium]|nr:AAA family ATPase [Candidatus Poribacteria bacterium]